MKAGAPANPNSACPRCGAAFRCGMVGGDSECWCVKLPNLMAVPSAGASNPESIPEPGAASCFCPACLQEIIDARSSPPSTARD
ncbi:MAG: cysteine-rich CWC family protein [Polaromonas sp.]|nr:cysteine-rich CWC family protein [Polaromonas sp.]